MSEAGGVHYARVPDAEMDVEDVNDPSVRRRGRGFGADASVEEMEGVKAGGFERLEPDAPTSELDERAVRSVEGWVIVVTNVHEEASEDDLLDVFMDYGRVKDTHLNLDRRTGYVKGYALIQYDSQEEAHKAIDACKKGLTLLEQPLDADYAFVRPPQLAPGARGGHRYSRRERSRSPMRS